MRCVIDTTGIRAGPSALGVRRGPYARVEAVNDKAWPEVRRILCVRLDNMGDVLMTTPALRALRRCFPEVHLTLLASPAGASVAARIPEIDARISVEAPWMSGAGTLTPAKCEGLVRRLRRGAYDAAVIFTACTQSPLPAALLCWLAGIPRRLAHCRENPYHLLTDRVKEREPEQGMRHEVMRQLALVGHVGARLGPVDLDQQIHFLAPGALPPRCGTPGPRDLLSATDCRPSVSASRASTAAAVHVPMRLSFSVSRRNRERLRERLQNHGATSYSFSSGPARVPWVVIHPGASAASRRWPAERFSDVARRMIELGWQVVVAGGGAERPLADAVAHGAGPRCLNLAGELGLGEFGALLQSASLLVANNSGPMHVAAALGTPVVVLYALTNPQHVPWQVPSRVLFHEVPCRGCLSSRCPEQHHRCLLGVTPEQVVEASIELLGTRSASHVHARHQRNLP